MVTGERALLARTDERFEWYDRDADGEWPAHARRAVVDGEVWHGEVDHDSQMDALGPVWGHIRMGGTWRRES